jgi:5-methylcytosine-specific restriction endonuclease McrA
MLSKSDFEKRVTALWQSQQRMAAPKKWRSGRRAGTIRKNQIPIEFTKPELEDWLWAQIGLHAIPCPYCGTPIDILSLTLDHRMPREIGGAFNLFNLQVVCVDCNNRKGSMTAEGFSALIEFSRTQSQHDRTVLLARLKAAHHGVGQRFFRPAATAKPVKQPAPDGLFDPLGKF